jgi:hypothetical protein
MIWSLPGQAQWLGYVITDNRQAQWLGYVITDNHQIHQIDLCFAML